MLEGRIGLLALLVAATACPKVGAAIDVPIAARKLTIIDKTAAGRGAKIGFVARDPKWSKGNGSDLNAIEADFRIDYLNVAGGFAVPAGARPLGAIAGWIKNDARGAQFLNSDADSGAPTGVKHLTIIEGKGAKLTARTIGDDAIPITTSPPPTVGLRTTLTITNDGEVMRYCTLFPGDEIDVHTNDDGRKLIAKNGIPFVCPSTPLTVAPVPDLPPPPSAPSLWFDGSDPNAVAAVVARTTNPETSGLYANIKATVDGSLASLGSASDDARAVVAKGAGLLYVVGAAPPGGSGYSSYRDVVVTALSGVGDRNGLDTLDEFLHPPADQLDVLRDAGRLQSMAEAYDFLRGAGVAMADDQMMRTRIANWADEYMIDWNLTGDPYHLFSGHRDNWAIKAGSALVTTALALPDHPNAAGWLNQGVSWISESLATAVLAPGWYGESTHYLNYSLNNLASTLWHLRNAADTDWFDDLAPLIDVALALRQPNGQQPPFEEGVANTFPWDVLEAAYPSRAATMQWALENSPQDFSSYDNQQFHAVTRFLVRPLAPTAEAPTTPPTMFIAGDTHAVILRSDWTTQALQLTGLTAIDLSSSEAVTSRHNMENPLDLVLHGVGALLLPTASGGPTVTTSPDRAYYLEPSSKNIPLVDGNARYILERLAVADSDDIDSQDCSAVTHRLLDAGTTTVQRFATGVDVSRTLAMVDDSYGVVIDRFISAAQHNYAVTWRGRGDGSVRESTASHFGADYHWPNTSSPTAHLAVDTVASAALSGSLVNGFYAPTFGVEETLHPSSITVAGSDATMLSILRPRFDGAPASTLTPITIAGGAAATVTQGSIYDVLIAGPEGTTRATAGIQSDGRVTLVRKTGSDLIGIAAVRATHVAIGSTEIAASAPITFAMTLVSGTAVMTIGSNVTDAVTITLTNFPNLDPMAMHTATFNGAPLPAESFKDSGNSLTISLTGTGCVAVAG